MAEALEGGGVDGQGKGDGWRREYFKNKKRAPYTIEDIREIRIED